MILHRLALTLLLGCAPALSASPSVPTAPVSLDVKGADLEEVLRLLAHAGDVNLVVDPSVGAGRRVTVRLRDVPWRQALDVVVRPQGLVAVQEGNVVRVAPFARLVQEEEQARRLAEAREQSGGLVTVAVPLSYGDATTAARLVQASLTARGSVVVDRRTNTLIVRDVARPAARATRATPDQPPPDVAVLVELRALPFARLPPHVDGSSDAALAGARLIAATRLALDLDDEILLDLAALADELTGTLPGGIVVSPRRDGDRVVLTVRDAAGGRDAWWADSRSVQVVLLPGEGDERALLVLRPA